MKNKLIIAIESNDSVKGQEVAMHLLGVVKTIWSKREDMPNSYSIVKDYGNTRISWKIQGE